MNELNEILYYTFIFPLEQVLDWALFTLFKATKNYGISIMLLSLLVNLFLLKLFIYTDKKAKEEAELKAKLDKKIKSWKKICSRAELYAYTKTLYRQHNYHPIYALRSLGGLLLQIPFFFAMYGIIKGAEYLENVGFLWIDDLSKPDSIMLFGYQLHILPILMTLFTLINVFYSSKILSSRIQGVAITLLFLFLLYDMPSSLVLYWTCNMLFALLKEMWKQRLQIKDNKNLKDMVVNDCGEYDKKQIEKLSLFNRIFTPHTAMEAKKYEIYRDISKLAIINICFLLCVFTPYALYSSDVRQFDINQTYQTLGVLFGSFLCSSLMVMYITSFFYKTRLFKIGAYIVNILLFFGLFNTFIFTGDYGSMDHFVLQNPNFNNPSLYKSMLYAASTLLISIIIVVLFLNKLKIIWRIAFSTLFIVSLINVYNITEANQAYKIPQTTDNNGLQPYEKELFSYSKHDKNIIVIVLDMFSGSHMNEILEQFPEFKTKLDGFILFDNTISTTNSTIHSIATLIGGEYYSAYNMNARRDNIVDSITESFGIIGDTFIKNGYGVSYFMSEAAKPAEYIQDYNKNIFVTQNSNLYIDYYLKQNPDDAIAFRLANEGNEAVYKRLLSFGVFRFSPYLIRDKIYNNGLWLRHKIVDYNVRSSLPYTSSFYAFTHLHNTSSKTPTFKFLHSMITHVPYGMYYNNNSCRFQSRQNHLINKTAWDDYPHKVAMPYRNEAEKNLYFKHYDSESCALNYLSIFIEWLKQEGIYDNTQIFVVSDHSGYDSIGIANEIVAKNVRPDALFLFKDFKAKGNLKIDSRLMTNYDSPSIFCENLPSGCPNVPKNIIKNYPNDREVIVTSPTGFYNKNEWFIDYYFRIKDSIYNKENWQDITEAVKNGSLKINGNH